MDLFSQSSESVGERIKYRYPNIPEYPIRELLLLEKESSGMYFSGHLIDSYARHLEALCVDKISEIIEFASDAESDNSSRYNDKAAVTVAGIITAKRTKLTKNGDAMAFIVIEDRYAEIEVIVFAKNYSKYSDILTEESAVAITGNLSTEDDEAPKILLSSAQQLKTDSEYAASVPATEQRIFIKVSSLSDSRINNLKRIIALNRGNAKIVLYDESTKKYCAMKDVMIDPGEKVLTRLTSLFGEKSVILK